MSRQKQWTTEDMERALQWVANKAKTGAIFRGQSQTAEELVPRLAGISDPAALAAELAAELTPEAWKRLLNALRQRKHAAGGESDSEDEGRQREDPAEKSVRKFQAAVYSLGSSLRELLRAGGIIAMIDRAHQHENFGPAFPWTIKADGPSFVIEGHPSMAGSGGTHAGDTDDGEILTRPGAVRLRVMIEPVTEVRRWINHTGAGTEVIEAAPDTWKNVGTRVISDMEQRQQCLVAIGAIDPAMEQAAVEEAERIEALRATVATWEGACLMTTQKSLLDAKEVKRAQIGPREMKDPRSREYAIQTLHSLKRYLSSRAVDERRIKEELADIKANRHWEVLGYASMDEYLQTETGHTLTE